MYKVNVFIVLTEFLCRLSQRIYGKQSMEHNQKSITKYLQKITDFVKLRMGDKIKLQIQCLEVGNQALSSEKLKSKLISEGEDIEAYKSWVGKAYIRLFYIFHFCPFILYLH